MADNPKKKRENRVKNHRIPFRVVTSDYNDIVQAAENRDVTITDYLLHLHKNDAFWQTDNYRHYADQYRKILEEMLRLHGVSSNNLNQIAQYTNTFHEPPLNLKEFHEVALDLQSRMVEAISLIKKLLP
ncbi:hypothetical protein V9K67_21490 [Paraflavisolibacter sp. H34]|uniref:hypothetical protein n=1 Tax=Huijunlia imazamoxiresistens TaxID=3127457 RepID=UPI003017CB73